MADGIEEPVKSIGQAIRLAEPGDTIHLQPGRHRDWAAFYGRSGSSGKPITLDGHGAVLDGCDPLTPDGWQEVESGLFRHDDLLPLTDAVIDRWFFLWNGQLQRMQRCSKGPSEPLKSAETLLPGEWTFVKDEQRSKSARPGYIHGAFYLRLPAGQTLSDADIEVPVRPNGVMLTGGCAHIVIRNITATRPYNDGFNISDSRDVIFENIAAVECGDDGISAHGDSQYSVDGFVSAGNATGICDTGNSQTSYRHVQIRDCIGFDLFFLDTGRYSVSDAVVYSKAAKAVYLQGRSTPSPPCCLTLNNVLIQRDGKESELRVSPNCQLTATRTSFLNLDVQATGGDLEFHRCLFAGDVPPAPGSSGSSTRKPVVHLWRDATWRGVGNRFDLDSWRIDQTTLSEGMLDRLGPAGISESGSEWKTVPGAGPVADGVGSDEAAFLMRQMDSLAVLRTQSTVTSGVVHLSTGDGVQFGIWPCLPDQPAPTLFVLANTIDNTLGGPTYRQAANWLGPEGYVCVTIDLPCHGEQVRENEPDGLSGWRHRCDSMENPMSELCQRLSGVLDHLIATGLTDPDRIAACGTSRGGFAALHFAAADHRVKCVAAFAPVTDLTALQEFRGAEENPLVQQLAADHLAEQLVDRAVWVIIGDRDERVSTDASVRFTRRVTQAALDRQLSPQAELHVLPEPRGHTTPSGGPEMASVWIRRQLHNADKAESP